MIKNKVKPIIVCCTVVVLVLAVLIILPIVTYLKILPWAVSNQSFVNYIESVSSKMLKSDVKISQPYIKTELSPEVSFGVGSVKISNNKKNILDIEKLDASISLSKIKHKDIIVRSVYLNNLFADVSSIMKLHVFTKKTEQKKSDWSVDIFKSALDIKNSEVVYNIDKNTVAKVNIKNLKIDENIAEKYVHYNITSEITKNKNKIVLKTSDNNNVYIENKEKLVVKNSEVSVNKSKIFIHGFVDNKSNYDIGLKSKAFSIPAVIDLLNSQIIENNLSEQLTYFKDIDGNFDFSVRVANKGMSGDVVLNKLSFKLIPFMNLPILLNAGRVTFDDKKIVLKKFKGYYNGKTANEMDFEGVVKDYLKSVDTDLIGNAVVTNDFSGNYLSKMIGYPIQIKGKADTRVMLKSKYGKIDLKWLYLFKKGNGFIVDGEESSMNNEANRVLYSVIHYEGSTLNIKSLNYYAGNPQDDRAQVKIPIVSGYGDIDFSNGETFIRRMGFELPKPMPSGFINMLTKQKLFKGGTFTGHFDVLNRKGYPIKIKSDLKVSDLRIPSQRLYIKNGEFKTDKDHLHIAANGKYRRSDYNLSGTVLNEVRFPIVVKNITLQLDDVDIEKYLQAFNAQNPTEAATDVNAEIAKSTANEIENDDDDTQTFDLANLIVEECILKVKKGFYKNINFANVVSTLTLDKNSLLKITTNKFDIAEGTSTAKVDCDLKNHKYSLWLALIKVNSDTIATSLLNLSKEINGKASGLIELNTDETLKLNGRIQFRIENGIISKIGLVEYAMKVAALFRNPLTMISPSVVSDLVSVPEGKFDKIDGDLRLKNNIVQPMMIKSSAPQLASFIIGTYNLENQDAALRIYTKFSNRRKGVYGFLRNISLNSLANRIPLSTSNDSNYYEGEISHIPAIDADEKDCQIFLTKVDGDIEHNNFMSSLKKIK